LRSPDRDRDRNVVLYGNSATNAAWKALCGGGPVQVARGRLQVGRRLFSGNDLCCIFIYPRPGSAEASVGAVSGTGIVGMKLANRLPYLSPGIGLPDCTVFDERILTSGDAGVLVTGFFGIDWSVERGEFAP
jgi:hypothetical protein